MNLANLLDRMGEFDAAEVLHQETVAGLSAAAGKSHSSRLMVRAATVRTVDNRGIGER